MASLIVNTCCDGRDLSVRLPASADRGGGPFPVLFALDGQNLFHREGHPSWELDRALDRLEAAGLVQETAVVGIHHAGGGRLPEYTPRFHAEGRSFTDWLVGRLIPWAAARWPLRADRADRGIMGSSRGGLMALHLANLENGPFGFCAALSPSEAWHAAEYAGLPRRPVRLWIDNGTADYVLGYGRSVATRQLVDGYLAQGHAYGDSLLFYEVDGGGHHERDWAARVANPLLMFQGDDPGPLAEFRIDVEVFHDDGRRPWAVANPVGCHANGLTASLYTLAEYRISAPAEIDRRGRFTLNGCPEARIEVRHGSLVGEALVTDEGLAALAAENLRHFPFSNT
jgi:enterochelin esterase-like enzyme